ncbi:MAG: glycosyltransferase family 2 protein [Methylobacterium sp.]|uniref:glycosyltransferase family 2 protein n=1 Tax=Methylobacterium sp. TaxID=409 RepID=UPI0025862A7F|nr:glycosyltransferase family 2 protein [Methylobacterium sp.]MBY0298363.1 glycosyltransferase family 2 protein [Methylobacterium sp.]
MAATGDIRSELQSLLPQASFVRNRAIAVLLPCLNEEATIGQVVAEFRRVLPGATVYVYDNNSTDGTAAVAAAAGAVVRRERRPGKGNVVRRMFADIDADLYVLADGDLTYDAAAAGRLIDALVTEQVDMVVGVRRGADGAFPRGHRFGNRLFNRVVERLFGDGFTDILSGYRVVSRRFAKSFPATSSGFEIETELSVHALDLRLATSEIALPYRARPTGSSSKLSKWRDGARILGKIALMYKAVRPLQFFSLLAALFAGLGFGLGLPVATAYLETGLVPRLPTAVLAAGLMQLAFMSLTCGVILDAVGASQREFKRMRYLDLPAPGARKAGL